MKASWLIAIPLMIGLLAACGGGGGGGGFVPIHSPTATPTPAPPAGNVQSMSVDLGPNGNLVNGAFTSVTVCVPNTANCQTIPNVLLDTGSFGLRLLGSALNPTLTLPRQTDGSGDAIAECGFFGSLFTWGPVATADIEMADEAASSIPVQIISPSGFTTAPTACINSGLPQADSLATLRANGILGVGVFVQDCGTDCTTNGSSNPGFYYACAGSSCSVTTQSEANQVQNPISSFSGDDNGLIIELPSVPAGGAKSVTGSLVFGIGTQSNNQLGTAQVFTTDSNGNVTTTFGGNSYGTTYIDTGSNALFFLSTAATGIPECSGGGFYCPASSENLSAQIEGQNSATATVDFTIANANNLFSTNNAVFNDLGGPFSQGFDWGLPFFLGRNVFVAIDGQTTPAGSGPYFAF
ncbi:MAG TPA: DUF3443 domain-containing protein [Candidatus Binataceae bacterium]|nr:DUF3443 domain-containing protein [Candidatus Binataceae bacterium]